MSLRSLTSEPRAIAALLLASSLTTIAGAWAYEKLGYLPCELCYKERVPYYAAIALAPLAGWAAQTGRAGLARGAFLLMALLFAGNAALSIYHSGVEWKIFAGPSDCSGAVTTAGLHGGFHEAAAAREGRALRRTRALGPRIDARQLERRDISRARLRRERGRAAVALAQSTPRRI